MGKSLVSCFFDTRCIYERRYVCTDGWAIYKHMPLDPSTEWVERGTRKYLDASVIYISAAFSALTTKGRQTVCVCVVYIK